MSNWSLKVVFTLSGMAPREARLLSSPDTCSKNFENGTPRGESLLLTRQCRILSQHCHHLISASNRERIRGTSDRGWFLRSARWEVTCWSHGCNFQRPHFKVRQNNVTSAKEMEKAILSHGGLPGIQVAVTDYLSEMETLRPQQRIAGISRLNNFSSFCWETGSLTSLWCWSQKEYL